MDLHRRFLYFCMFVLSVASAGICVHQIIQAETVYAVAAAVVFVIAFVISIDGILLYYFERFAQFVVSQKGK